MQRFLGLIISAVLASGLISCSSNSSESAEAPKTANPEGTPLVESNPFTFSNEDVQQGGDLSITGGKRSQFERQAESAYARANANTPAYLQKDFASKSWLGSREYRTGAHETGSYRKSGQRSRFSGRSSNESGTMAGASGRGYSTGGYRTGKANENGRFKPTGSSAYVDEQANDGWRSIQILEEKEYRSISMGQAKSLLGR